MRYYRLALIFLGSLALFTGCTKSPQEFIALNKSFGGSRLDKASSIVKTPDGGFAIAGSTESSDGDLAALNSRTGFSTDAWIFKINRTGKVQWSKKLGGSGSDVASCIINTADGGLVTAGYSETANGEVTTNHGGTDAWIIKFDKDGQIQWKRNFGGSRNDLASSIIQDVAGDYVFTGKTFSADGDLAASFGYSDLWVVKLSSDGKLIWSKNFGGNEGEYGSSVVNSPDGGYLVAGETWSKNGIPNYHGGTDVLVVKIASDGSLIWQKAYGGSDADESATVVPSLSGGFVVAALTSSKDGDLHGSRSNPDTWLFEINNLGNIIWEKAYGGSDIDGPSQLTTNAEGYSLTGSTHSLSAKSQSQFMFMTVDPDGRLMARKTRQGRAFEKANALAPVAWNKFMIAGSSSSGTGSSAQSDAWIFTFDL